MSVEVTVRPLRPITERPFSLDCGTEGKTVQASKDECDINILMSRYEKTGTLPINTKQPIYGDFSNVSDYMDAVHQTAKAQAMFDALPARIRDRFGNSPEGLLEFMDDPQNLDEAIELGLVPPDPDLEVPPDPPADPAPPPDPPTPE